MFIYIYNCNFSYLFICILLVVNIINLLIGLTCELRIIMFFLTKKFYMIDKFLSLLNVNYYS